jgi:hypothetical protein
MSTFGQISPRFEVSVEEDIGRLNDELALYMKLSKLTAEEVVAKKGLDLNIKLFRGFWALRARGGRNAFKGPMFTDAKARGWRVRVRRKELVDEPYASIQRQGYIERRYKNKKGKDVTRKLKRSRRGLLVAQELAFRQRGAGLLGVTFLQRRWRKNSANRGRFLAVNKSKRLGELSMVETGPLQDGAFFRLRVFTPGIDTVGESRGIFATAIRQVREDTAVYLVRKNMEALRKSLRTP